MALISPDRIPAEVIWLCQKLSEAGYSAYVVGGAVRDLLLYDASSGQYAKDFDVATAAHPEEVVRIFGARRTIPTGIAHGTVTVLCDRSPEGAGGADLPPVGEHRHRHIEVTTFRGESSYSDGRRPDRIHFIDDLVEDLRRRDFTINAIAYDPLSNTLHDPFGGQTDLAESRLRAVGDPAQRFAEDGLRLMRAVRFVARLNLSIEPSTRHAFAAALPTLRKVSRERVRDELNRLIETKTPSIGLRHLFEPTLAPDEEHGPLRFDGENSLLSVALPEVCAVLADDGVAARAWMRLVDACPPAQRWAALLWPLRRAGAGVAAGLPQEPKQLSALLDDRFKLPLAQRQHLAKILLLPDIAFDQADSFLGPQLRRLMAAHPPALLDDWLTVRGCELGLSESGAAQQARLHKFGERLAAERAGRPALSIGELSLSGQDLLQALSLPPGPQVGQVLRHLLEYVLDDPEQNQRERLLAEAARFASPSAARPEPTKPEPAKKERATPPSRERTEKVRQAIMRMNELLGLFRNKLQAGERAYDELFSAHDLADAGALHSKERQWRLAEQLEDLTPLRDAVAQLRFDAREMEKAFAELHAIVVNTPDDID